MLMLQISITVDNKPLVLDRVAWTGGDVPSDSVKATKLFRALSKAYFREQVNECGGLDLWKCAGTEALERARIFWNRAECDAWATMRDSYNRQVLDFYGIELE